LMLMLKFYLLSQRLHYKLLRTQVSIGIIDASDRKYLLRHKI